MFAVFESGCHVSGTVVGLRELAVRLSTAPTDFLIIVLGRLQFLLQGHAFRDRPPVCPRGVRQKPVLFVNEGLHLQIEILEKLRLLTNYDMDSENRHCLLQVGLTEISKWCENRCAGTTCSPIPPSEGSQSSILRSDLREWPFCP